MRRELLWEGDCPDVSKITDNIKYFLVFFFRVSGGTLRGLRWAQDGEKGNDGVGKGGGSVGRGWVETVREEGMALAFCGGVGRGVMAGRN